MVIEQRIGRLHRMGQEREVLVCNLCARGTVEERVLGVLSDRLHLFELVVGEIRGDAHLAAARGPGAAIAAKVAHLAAERHAKLSELGQRLSLRVSVGPVAILLVSVPVTEVRVRVRRRKREGEILLRLPAGASALDLVACDACAGATAKPLVCDDALHRICERCLPSAEGRPRCPACAR